MVRYVEYKVIDHFTREVIGYEWMTPRGWNHDLSGPDDTGFGKDGVFSRKSVDRYQFTGIFTIAGEKIYEGDILKDGGSIGVVEYHHGSFVIVWITNPDNHNPVVVMHNKRIVGSVYSPPPKHLMN